MTRRVWIAAKLYPAGATTNSASGVTDIRKIYPVLERMQRIGMVLCIHGEVTDPEVDVFDREKIFIATVLLKLVSDFPELKIVLEHITTKEAVEFVHDCTTVGATVTPQHLIINRNAIFSGGLRPHSYCLPVAKREEHRLAVRKAATSGWPNLFLGTDSAPPMPVMPRRAPAAALESSMRPSRSKATQACSTRMARSSISKLLPRSTDLGSTGSR